MPEKARRSEKRLGAGYVPGPQKKRVITVRRSDKHDVLVKGM